MKSWEELSEGDGALAPDWAPKLARAEGDGALEHGEEHALDRWLALAMRCHTRAEARTRFLEEKLGPFLTFEGRLPSLSPPRTRSARTARSLLRQKSTDNVLPSACPPESPADRKDEP